MVEDERERRLSHTRAARDHTSVGGPGTRAPPLTPPQPPSAAPAGPAAAAPRLAEALRDNLRKRKAQVRDRAAAGPVDTEDGEAGGGEA